MRLIILSLLAVSLNLGAKTFTNKYCEFQLPTGWECALEGSEWVCQSSSKDRKKEAIIILAAKLRGPSDSLADYQAYLKKAKSFKIPGGKTQISEGKYTKIKNIKSHRWIDSLHLASEVPGFYTRYLATVKEDLGVVVTFSVGKDHYQSYQDVFEKIVGTLKVFRQKNAAGGEWAQIKQNKGDDLLEGDIVLDPTEGNYDIGANRQKSKVKSGSGSDDLMLYGLLALVVGFFVMKKLKGRS